MAQSGTVVKTKIENKIFTKPPATDITIYKRSQASTGSYGGYGGQAETYSEFDKIETIGVPYGFISGDRAYFSFGLTVEGETKIAVKQDTDVEQEDRIVISTHDNITFKVLKVQEYPYNNVNLAKILTIKEDVSTTRDGDECNDY